MPTSGETISRPRGGPDGGDDPVIRVVDLVKRFGDREVLKGVSFEVYPRETLVIMGGSGCGKSTLLKHIIGSMWPDQGHVELLGRRIENLDEHDLDEVRKRFGILFQSGALFNSMTVGENVALPLREHTPLDSATIAIIVKMKLEQVGLRSAEDLMPAEISGGMKKRAGLARAIALDPAIVFYDEPSAGLDPVTSAEIDELILDLTGGLGLTSVVVTHEMDSAFRIADRMVMLDQGQVLKIASREQFEQIRDSKGPLDEQTELIRQFLRGDSKGPITRRRLNSGYEEDLLNAAAEGMSRRRF